MTYINVIYPDGGTRTIPLAITECFVGYIFGYFQSSAAKEIKWARLKIVEISGDMEHIEVEIV